MKRRLLLVGIGLVIGGILGVSPIVGYRDLAVIVVSLVIVLSGLSAVFLFRRTHTRLVTVFLWSTYISIAGSLVVGFIPMVQQIPDVKSYTVFHIVGSMLTYIGGPILWGAALARREDPGSLSALKAGRLSAGAVQVGFMFMFAAELRIAGQFGLFNRTGAGLESAVSVLLRVSDVAERVLLLWASIECLRAAVDDEVILRRAVRINRLMGGWLLLAGLTAILGQVQARLAGAPTSSHMDLYVWRSAVLLLLTYAGALAVSNRLAVRNPGPGTVARSTPVSGAEA